MYQAQYLKLLYIYIYIYTLSLNPDKSLENIITLCIKKSISEGKFVYEANKQQSWVQLKCWAFKPYYYSADSAQ